MKAQNDLTGPLPAIFGQDGISVIGPIECKQPQILPKFAEKLKLDWLLSRLNSTSVNSEDETDPTVSQITPVEMKALLNLKTLSLRK